MLLITKVKHMTNLGNNARASILLYSMFQKNTVHGSSLGSADGDWVETGAITSRPQVVPLGYLLATRWRSFTSERSNQTWGQALTMAL